jgi:formylglycine-generating enzyme required for sulfatase activity
VTAGSYSCSNQSSCVGSVSDFRLDRYEITVGRFRAFMNAGMGTRANPPAAGTGADPHIANSGWESSYDANLADAGALTAALKCDPPRFTWTDVPLANENRPINCITWYEAFAFCIWDGGRLPTELEWEFAAAGGNEQRAYPWGNTAPGPDAMLAVHDCYYGGTGLSSCSDFTNIAPVGSAPLGNGKWGQADLAGNVWEWNFDWLSQGYLMSCVDCANLVPSVPPSGRSIRGGCFNCTATTLGAYYRNWGYPDRRSAYGARCARSP